MMAKKMISAILVLAMLCVPAMAMAEGTGITVSATGTIMIDADTATVTLGVKNISADVLTAQASVNEAIAAIMAKLIEGGVMAEDITTDRIYISANYDYSADVQEKITGYTASNMLSIRTKNMDLVGSIIDMAFAAGANTLDDVVFSISDDKEYQDQALSIAVEKALAKANVIAEAAGLKVKSIDEINAGEIVSRTYGVSVNLRMESATADSGAAATSVSGAQIPVVAEVTIKVEAE